MGFSVSIATATSGTQQVGYGMPSILPYAHALLWRGTAESAVDLNPADFLSSIARATEGAQQIGNGFRADFAGMHAQLWNNTAGTAVDLNPAGYVLSDAFGVGGGEQVGYASITKTVLDGQLVDTGHAMLWRGIAASAVDLNPAGFNVSRAAATNGSIEVGFGRDSAGDPNALLWKGTAASVVNLHSLLASNYTWSLAYCVDARGEVFGVARDATGNAYAVEWTPVPEPKFHLMTAVAGLLLARRRKMGDAHDSAEIGQPIIR